MTVNCEKDGDSDSEGGMWPLSEVRDTKKGAYLVSRCGDICLSEYTDFQTHKSRAQKECSADVWEHCLPAQRSSHFS